MANKFARKKYYDVANIAGIEQLDLLSFKWLRFSRFLRDREVLRYQVTADREGRLDRISADFYNNVFLYWIIALANDILDPINDVSIGTTLVIPSASDIEAYFQTIVNRRQRGQEALLPRIDV